MSEERENIFSIWVFSIFPCLVVHVPPSSFDVIKTLCENYVNALIAFM